jgi:hypothetical protein
MDHIEFQVGQVNGEGNADEAYAKNKQGAVFPSDLKPWLQ